MKFAEYAPFGKRINEANTPEEIVNIFTEYLNTCDLETGDVKANKITPIWVSGQINKYKEEKGSFLNFLPKLKNALGTTLVPITIRKILHNYGFVQEYQNILDKYIAAENAVVAQTSSSTQTEQKPSSSTRSKILDRRKSLKWGNQKSAGAGAGAAPSLSSLGTNKSFAEIVKESFKYKKYKDRIDTAASAGDSDEVFKLFEKFFTNVFSEYVKRTKRKSISLNKLDLNLFINPSVTTRSIVSSVIKEQPGNGSCHDNFCNFLRDTCGFTRDDLEIIRDAFHPLVRRGSVVDEDKGKERKFLEGGHAQSIYEAQNQAEIEARLIRFFKVVKSTHSDEGLEPSFINYIKGSFAKINSGDIAKATGINNARGLGQTHHFTKEILTDIQNIHSLMEEENYNPEQIASLRTTLMTDSKDAQKRSDENNERWSDAQKKRRTNRRAPTSSSSSHHLPLWGNEEEDNSHDNELHDTHGFENNRYVRLSGMGPRAGAATRKITRLEEEEELAGFLEYVDFGGSSPPSHSGENINRTSSPGGSSLGGRRNSTSSSSDLWVEKVRHSSVDEDLVKFFNLDS